MFKANDLILEQKLKFKVPYFKRLFLWNTYVCTCIVANSYFNSLRSKIRKIIPAVDVTRHHQHCMHIYPLILHFFPHVFHLATYFTVISLFQLMDRTRPVWNQNDSGQRTRDTKY